MILGAVHETGYSREWVQTVPDAEPHINASTGITFAIPRMDLSRIQSR